MLAETNKSIEELFTNDLEIPQISLQDIFKPHDSIVKKESIGSPYRIQYEMFENESYPVITLLKGTVLVTYRRLNNRGGGDDYYHKYLYLNKLNVEIGESSEYTDEFIENSLTYFYPIPYYASIVGDNYDTIDFVTLTADTKLLCLISPSNLSRGQYQEETKTNMVDCPSREHDLCLSFKLMQGLGLQGYIGIVGIDTLLKMLTENPFGKTKNNMKTVEEKVDKELMKNILNKCCLDKAEPDEIKISMPEIVLVPFLFHKHDTSVYKNQQESFKEFENESMSVVRKYEVDNLRNFSFFSFLSRTGKDLVTATVSAANTLEKYPTDMPYLVQSLQSPMFSLFQKFADKAKKGVFWKDHVFSLDEFDKKDVDFFGTYEDPATSVSAFETLMYYTKQAKSKLTGGIFRKNKSKSRTRKLYSKKKWGFRFLPRYSRKKTSKKSTKTMKTTQQLSFDENKGIVQTKNSKTFAKMVGNIPFLIVEPTNKPSKSKSRVSNK